MASGKDTTEEDRQQYLKNNPANHRVLKRFEIENYLYDKEVLRKYCEKNQLQFDENAYDAFVLNIDDQNLKDDTTRIKNICGIKSSVNPETFKKNLADYIDDSMNVFQELSRIIFARE